jgi:DNA-binding response OmpR family regulator
MSRILIIDDDVAVRLTIQAILERDGYEITCASDGDQGIRAFSQIRPQLVITDIIMPNKEGIETIIQLRALNQQIPIIAMSGGGRTGNADFLKMALKVGATEILRKPFERQELSATVRKFLPIGAQASH